jgi:hypothetical protein
MEASPKNSFATLDDGHILEDPCVVLAQNKIATEAVMTKTTK